MPLYQLFCMAKPALGRPALAEIMRTASNGVLTKGGVLTDILSYGQQKLAYDIRKQGSKYSKADIFQISFMVGPDALEEIEFNLKVDERILRYVIQKKEALPSLPNTYKVQKMANELLARDPSLQTSNLGGKHD